MKNGLRGLALSSVLTLLAACGGGDGGVPSSQSGGSSGGGAPTATTFAASGGGPLLASITFDTNGNGVFDTGEPAAQTDVSGLAGVSVTGLAANNGAVPTAPTARLLAFGADAATGFMVAGLSAPKGAVVISPVTTIIDKFGDQASVRRAFGLSLTGSGIRDTTDLLSFAAGQRLGDPDVAVAQDAARVTSLNFRIISLMQLLSPYQGDPVDVGSGTSAEPAQWIAEVIRETGSADFTNPDIILRALQKGNPIFRYQPEQLQVAAETFAKFMRIVPTAISDQQAIFRHHLAFRFFVLANIRSAYAAYPSTELARVRALTETDMRDAVARFADTPRPAVGASAYALPDYLEVRGPTAIAPVILLRNDVMGFPYGVGPDGKTLTGVSVDSRFASQVTVSRLADGSVSIAPVGGFTGYVYFDYTARSGNVDTSARVHVLVRPQT